jgi:hypothetical protein
MLPRFVSFALVAQTAPSPDTPCSGPRDYVTVVPMLKTAFSPAKVCEWGVPCQTLWSGHSFFETAPKNAYELLT